MNTYTHEEIQQIVSINLLHTLEGDGDDIEISTRDDLTSFARFELVGNGKYHFHLFKP
jgi:hypothetical protein